jgi:tetratricopeptide (TPR) repeat protein
MVSEIVVEDEDKGTSKLPAEAKSVGEKAAAGKAEKVPVGEPLAEAQDNGEKNSQAKDDHAVSTSANASKAAQEGPLAESDTLMQNSATEKQQSATQGTTKVRSDRAISSGPSPQRGVIFLVAVVLLVLVAIFVNGDKQRSELLSRTAELIDRKNYEDALQLTELGCSRYPSEPMFHFFKAQLLYKQNLNDKALEEVAIAASARPDDLEIIALRAALLNKCNNFELALADYNRLVSDPQWSKKAAVLAGRAEVELALKQYSKAVDDINASLPFASNSISDLTTRARIYEKLVYYDKAAKDWSKIIAIAPNDAIAYAERARVEYESGQTNKALNDLSKSLAITPSAAALFYRGTIYKELNQPDKADADLRAALRHSPSNTAIAKLLQQRNAAHGTFQDAVSSFDVAASALTAQATPYFYESKIKAEIAAGYFRQALGELNELIKNSKDNDELRAERALCFEQLRDYTKAYSEYSYLLQRQPQHRDLYLKRAAVAVKEGKFWLADNDVEHAMALDGKKADAYVFRGTTSLNRKLYRDALVDFKRALSLEPNNVSIKQKLEESRRLLGERGTNRALASGLEANNASVEQNVEGSGRPLVESSANRNTAATSSEPAQWKLAKDLVQKDPLNAAYQLLMHGEGPAAIPILMDLIKKDPGNLQARRYLAWDCSDLGQAPMAIEQFKILEQSNQLRPVDLPKYAFALEKLGTNDATPMYVRALAANPRDMAIRNSLCRSCLDTGDYRILELTAWEGLQLARTDADKTKFRDYLNQARSNKLTPKTQ